MCSIGLVLMERGHVVFRYTLYGYFKIPIHIPIHIPIAYPTMFFWMDFRRMYIFSIYSDIFYCFYLNF